MAAVPLSTRNCKGEEKKTRWPDDQVSVMIHQELHKPESEGEYNSADGSSFTSRS